MWGVWEGSRVGTTDPAKNNRAPNPKGHTVPFQIWKSPVVLFVVGNLCGWLFGDLGQSDDNSSERLGEFGVQVLCDLSLSG